MKKQMQSFTNTQSEFISREAGRLGVSQAEVVRRALDWYMDTYPGRLTIEQAADNPETIIHSD